MRMFLVGMCDIFLLLYLTTLTNISPAAMSNVTLTDFVKIQKTKEELENRQNKALDELGRLKEELEFAALRAKELEKLAAKAAVDREKADRESKSAKSDLAASHEEAEEAMRAAKKAAQLAELRLKEAAKAKKEAERRRQEAEAAQQAAAKEHVATLKAKEQLQEAVAKVNAVKKEVQQGKQQRKQLVQQLEVEKTEAEEVRRKVLELESRLATAQTQTAEYQAQASAAMQEAQTAKMSALEAQRGEDDAKLVAKVASMARTHAEAAANTARLIAVEREQNVREARVEVAKVKTTVRNLTQSAPAAYRRNVFERFVKLVVKTKSENILLGSSKDSFSRSVLPVNMEGKVYVLVPLSQLGELGQSPKRLLRLKLSIGGSIVTQIWVSPRAPHVVAFPVPEEIGVEDAKGMVSLVLMPTLLAVRNNMDLGFVDRVRDLDTEYFVFPRDKLVKIDSEMMDYRVSGIRGTGDFAQQIVAGDQIVDLEGRFLGIAVSRNKIKRIQSIKDWQELKLNKQNFRGSLKSLDKLLH